MKKLLIAGLLVVSVGLFARSYNNFYHMHDYERYETEIYQNLTPEQSEKLSALEKETSNIRRKYALEIQTKNLEVQRIMIEDKIDWEKVEKINGEIAYTQAKMRTESMKFNRKAYEITGYEHRNGMTEFCGGRGISRRGHMF